MSFDVGARSAFASSSNFPLWDGNQNTLNGQDMSDELMNAEQTIYHSSEYPSHIILPLIPP
ncbi:hypothetical protein CR157_12295 [Halomonas sp. LBP4]|nr:hypothetical protein CR157_12295 [Halomonas sp. LBP4]